MADAAYWVHRLGLQPHPEGGFFKEYYRSEQQIAGDFSEFPGERNFSTAINYLLSEEDFSAFHRIKSDEIWHMHAGDSLDIHIIFPDGGYEVQTLGYGEGESLSVVVPAGAWFAAGLKEQKGYVLAACTVSPGFDFRDFEMADSEELAKEFPQHKEIIGRFSR